MVDLERGGEVGLSSLFMTEALRHPVKWFQDRRVIGFATEVISGQPIGFNEIGSCTYLNVEKRSETEWHLSLEELDAFEDSSDYTSVTILANPDGQVVGVSGKVSATDHYGGSNEKFRYATGPKTPDKSMGAGPIKKVLKIARDQQQAAKPAPTINDL